MNNATEKVTESRETSENEQNMSSVIQGQPISIRDGFDALSFRHTAFDKLMDPLIMVDHYTMTKPTFGAHPHAGLSAVSLLFEDSIGRFHNQDSLGNDFDLLPGDLYWLNAGSGVVHDESPRKGSKIHGLQVFVNLPKSLKQLPPSSTLVRSKDMPLLTGPNYRVRIAMGSSNDIDGAIVSSNHLTILDGTLFGPSKFTHQSGSKEQSWIYAVSGNIEVIIEKTITSLTEGQAISTQANAQTIDIINKHNEEAHFVLFSGGAIEEEFVQRGPFAMSTEAELDKVQREYELGKFGTVGKKR